jgi:uncharacterized protein (DUF305 family)
MVPHHEAGIALDDLALARTDDVRVRHLAFEMNGYQGDELTTLRRIAGGVARPDDAHGMPTAAELDELARLRGPSFDRRFLTAMIRHHEGAVAMAGHLDGASDEVRRLAATIVTAQTAQLERMRALLTELGAAP